MDSATVALLLAVFAASFVEMVEATTIVMAMGFTRSWRPALLGTAAGLAAAAVVTAIMGYALATWLPDSALQLVIGTLLLIFGLQWLRKAIRRSSGRQGLHDEEAIYRRFAAEAERAPEEASGSFDLFAFMVSFKGVFLEAMEVVFIVITFGLGANNIPVAAAGAAIAVVPVLVLAVALHRPLSMIPENALKYGVGLLLATFGTFWSLEGLGIFRGHHESLVWPGRDLALIVLLLAWLLLSRVFVAALRKPTAPANLTTERVA